MPTRQERLVAVAELRALGLTQVRIAETLGLSRGYVAELMCDPDRSRLLSRRALYAGTCEVCGRKTDGSNGSASAPKRCAEHADYSHLSEERRGKGPLQAKILAAIDSGVTRFTDIYLTVGTTKSVLAPTINRLVAYGLVERVSRGQYRIVRP